MLRFDCYPQQHSNSDGRVHACRSAVHAHLEDWEKSRDDARTCVSLRGTWAKGWVRLGHALMGLEEWEEAKEALSRARELEPDDQKIEKAWQKVTVSLCLHAHHTLDWVLARVCLSSWFVSRSC